MDERAIAAVTCGAVGLFVFNVVLGPLALGLGVFGWLRSTGARGKAVAALGVLLGLADLALLAVLTFQRYSA